MRHSRKIAVVGLGYVGLPVAVAFAQNKDWVRGYDIDQSRIDALSGGHDATGEVSTVELQECGGIFTSVLEEIRPADFYIVTVPTPIDDARRPDLRALRGASRAVGRVLTKGDIVVFESTVYPGSTRDDCVPELEAASGLKCGIDFSVGYSPERINPGDKTHTFRKIKKVVSASDGETLEIVADVYGSVVEAGVYRATSIETAEAAKVIENSQRDLNIAFVNELALICGRLGLDTNDVLDAASTKWNFLPFRPGLVGGHCIGVDPYYLTDKAQRVGYHPEVILAGRRLNDNMGAHIARECVRHLLKLGAGRPYRVTILGLTFKENVPDIRNTRVVDIIAGLREHGIDVQVVDPWAEPGAVRHEYGWELASVDRLAPADAVVLAVPHRQFAAESWQLILRCLRGGEGICFDVKGVLDRSQTPAGVHLIRL